MTNLWIIICIFLLFFLFTGLFLIYLGTSRVQHAHNTCVIMFLLFPTSLFAWIMGGHGISFSPTLEGYYEFQGWLVSTLGMTPVQHGQSNPIIIFIFNYFFCLIASGIVVGASLERANYFFICSFIFLWILFIYAPIARLTTFENGLLKREGLLDFAGGLLVHVNSGFSALALSIFMGRRLDFFNLRKKYNNGFMALGFLLTFVGWLGFNGGSSLSFSKDVPLIIINTVISAFSGLFAWSIIDLLYTPHRLSIGSCGLGLISGLVGITPGALYLAPIHSLFVGVITSAAGNYSSRYMIKVLKIDDASESFSTHGIAGLLGGILTAMFCLTKYIPTNITRTQLVWINFKSSLIISSLSFFGSFLLIYITDKIIKARCPEEDEKNGLDIIYHGERIINP
jgi:Amt family ammonium transporter